MPATRASQNASNPHHEPYKKQRIKAAIKYRNLGHLYGARLAKAAIFESEGVSLSAGKRHVADMSKFERIFSYKDLPNWVKTREAPNVVTLEHIRRMEEILHTSDVQTSSMK